MTHSSQLITVAIMALLSGFVLGVVVGATLAGLRRSREPPGPRGGELLLRRCGRHPGAWVGEGLLCGTCARERLLEGSEENPK